MTFRLDLRRRRSSERRHRLRADNVMRSWNHPWFIARAERADAAWEVNALAESVIGLFKAKVIRRGGPQSSLEDVEFATLEWVWWFNYHRLLGPIGYVPPAEYEETLYNQLPAPVEPARLNETSLR